MAGAAVIDLPNGRRNDATGVPNRYTLLSHTRRSLPLPWSYEMSTVDHPLAEFYQALGHDTHAAFGVLWIDVGRFSLTCVPCSSLIEATQLEVEGLLRRARRLAAVFPTPEPTGIGGGTLWVRDRGYGAHSLQRQFRQHVRRGEKLCVVRPIDWETLHLQGVECNLDTLHRRGVRASPIQSPAGWSRVCQAAAHVEGLEAFGCFQQQRLVAYLIAWTRGGLCAGLVMHRSRAAEPVRGAHLLFHEFTKIMLSREAIRGVSLGRIMLPTQDSLEQFKRHAGYQVEPIQVAAVLHPVVRGPLGNAFTRGVLRSLRRLAGNRPSFLDNVAVLDAAAMTQLPRRATAGR